ncbi:hypothetical protein VUR80DRAFT_7164 [Thermomyces stellatus]
MLDGRPFSHRTRHHSSIVQSSPPPSPDGRCFPSLAAPTLSLAKNTQERGKHRKFTWPTPLHVSSPLHLLAWLPALPSPPTCSTPHVPLYSCLSLLEAGWVQPSFFALLIGSHRPRAPASLPCPYNSSAPSVLTEHSLQSSPPIRPLRRILALFASFRTFDCCEYSFSPGYFFSRGTR